ncbi:MAG TPA: peptide transporter [Armatimonadota bacterium]|nr:peptide transporter [Armatimonadota bacterium]
MSDLIQETGDEPLQALPDVVNYVSGFSWKTVAGVLFVAILMIPASIYMGLVTGQGSMGAAAEWVTIILFTEVCKRSFVNISKQELYVLFYVAAGLTSAGALAGGPFAGFIWNQFLEQGEAAKAFHIANKIPHWVVPPPGSPALVNRTFLQHDWLAPIGLMVFGSIVGRLTGIGLGYTLFRITSDVERLPFPLAPIGAAGATALAETSEGRETWRWRVFSTGCVIGIIWGFFYIAIPTITGGFLAKPLQLLPIPFLDLTPNTEHLFPGSIWGLNTDLGSVFTGFILPFPMVVGNFCSSMFVQMFANPYLARHGFFPDWHYGFNTIWTQLVTNFDFWLSFNSIGMALSVGIIGILTVAVTIFKRRKEWFGQRGPSSTGLGAPPPGRGDFPIWLMVGLWFIGTMASIGMVHYLVPGFPIIWLFFYGILWTPLSSYISARMIGLTGSGVGFPMIKEGSFLLSHYVGVDIWFAPIPLGDYGGAAQFWRQVELTGTKFTSIIYAELIMLPTILLFSFLYWSYFWHLGPIPSVQYPYAMLFWPRDAMQQILWMTAWMGGGGGNPMVRNAIQLPRILGGLGTGLVGYGIVKLSLGAFLGGMGSDLFYYGLVGGIGAMPHGTIPMMFGALLGRFYFAKRFGKETWNAYVPVALAGYACGMGLVGMCSTAIRMIGMSVSHLPF